MTDTQTIHVGLDIGTTKAVAVVASTDARSRRIEILGKGTAPSDGLKRGVVTNISKTADAIRSAVDQAEAQSGIRIGRVHIGIAGDHVQSLTTRGIVTVSSPTREISFDDVQRMLDDVRRVSIGPDRRILHVIPQEFIIDGQGGITDPVGMSGIRLEANVLIITGLITAADNMTRCAERAGLDVDHIVLQPLASGLAVLDEGEREIGVALVDIGGGTTDIAIFKDGILRSTSIFSIAGQKVTDDIMALLHIRNMEAERIKVEFGHAYADTIMKDLTFQVPGVGGRSPMDVKKSLLCQIIEPRMEEIFEFALQEILQSKLAHQLSAGAVITGGSSMISGSTELAQKVFRMPVKLGIPAGFSMDGMAQEVSTPVYATAVGLIHYAVQQDAEALRAAATAGTNIPKQTSPDVESTPGSPEPQQTNKGLFGKLRDWLEDL
jgi:cell division protein FtsA